MVDPLSTDEEIPDLTIRSELEEEAKSIKSELNSLKDLAEIDELSSNDERLTILKKRIDNVVEKSDDFVIRPSIDEAIRNFGFRYRKIINKIKSSAQKSHSKQTKKSSSSSASQNSRNLSESTDHIEDKKQKKLEEEREKRDKIEEKIRSRQTEFEAVDSRLLNAEFEEAADLLDSLRSSLHSLEQEASNEGYDELEKQAVESVKKCDGYLSRDRVLELLQEMDPYKFENLIARLWEQLGWDTTVTSGTKDKGIDIIAKKDKYISLKYVIQAKRFAKGNKIGSDMIRTYSTLKNQEDRVDAVIIASTSSYTDPAKQLGYDLNVKLIDGETLYQMLSELSGRN